MSSAVPIFSAICFILLQVILIDIARGEIPWLYNNSTHHASQGKSAVYENSDIIQINRLKRSPPEKTADSLRMRIKYEDGVKVDLKLTKVQQYLANQYLPVITSADYSNLNVMEDVGEFETFQDVGKCSAVVYFKKYNTLFGTLGLDHALTNLPYEFDDHGNYLGEVERSYISKRAGIPVHNNPLLFGSYPPPAELTCSVVGGIKQQSDSDPGANNKHQRAERELDEENYGKLIHGNVSRIRNRRGDSLRDRYNLEILVIVTIDVVEFFKKLYGGNYLEWLVRYYIIYFNAVDMTFKQLPTQDFVLRINIAKIVIEDSTNPFDFASNEELQSADTILKLREYLKTNQRMFTPDSYDHVFLSTSRLIKDNSIFIAGTRDTGVGHYEARDDDKFYNGVPITIVGFVYDYVLAVHEISRTFNIESDSWLDGLEREGQCSSIMQEGSSKCSECFKWNEDSKIQFRRFFSGHRDRCFLLNEPRSIRPPGVRRFISAIRQCQCYGYDTTGAKSRSSIRSDSCNMALQCGKRVKGIMTCVYALRPFDGTNCGRSKVCWNGECTALEI